jgi:hypothetical protein
MNRPSLEALRLAILPHDAATLQRHRNERAAFAINSVLRVLEQTGRSRFTDTDAQAALSIAGTLDYLASGEAADNSDRAVPEGCMPDETAGPRLDGLAQVQSILDERAPATPFQVAAE